MKIWKISEIDAARKRPRPGYPRGQSVRELCEEVGCSPETYYSWRRKGEARPIRAIARALEKYLGDGALE